MASISAWEAIFMLVVLKIPMIYLGAVVLWAVRAEPAAGRIRALRALVPLTPCGWDDWRRRRARGCRCAVRCGRPARPGAARMPGSLHERDPAPQQQRADRVAGFLCAFSFALAGHRDRPDPGPAGAGRDPRRTGRRADDAGAPDARRRSRSSSPRSPSSSGCSSRSRRTTRSTNRPRAPIRTRWPRHLALRPERGVRRAQLLEQYLENPEAVDPAWRELFERGDDASLAPSAGLGRSARPRGERRRQRRPRPYRTCPRRQPDGPATDCCARRRARPRRPRLRRLSRRPSNSRRSAVCRPAVADVELLQAVASAMALVDAIRSHGHLAARLDPLGSEPLGDPALEESELAVPLPPEIQGRSPRPILGVHVEGETLADVLPRLREVYCGTIAYEIEHISDQAERAWLRQAIESGRFRQPLPPEQRRALLRVSRRSRRSRRTSGARSSGRSSSRSRVSTRSCRCWTRPSSSRRPAARTRS